MTAKTNQLYGIAYALVAFSLWVVGDTFIKLAIQQAMPKYEVMLIGSLSGMVALFTLVTVQRETKRLRIKKHYGPIFFLGLLYFANYFFLLRALEKLPLATFYAIIFLAPTICSVFAVFLMKEKLKLSRILAIIVGFGGVIIAVDPAQLLVNQSDWLSYGSAFMGMLVISTQMLTIRITSNTETRETLAFYPRIAGVICGSALVFLHGFVVPSTAGLIYAACSGIVGALGWTLMAHAWKLAPVSTVAPFHYSQIVTGGLVGFLIWNDVPSPHLILGAAVIIAAGIYIARHAHKSELVAELIAEEP